MTNILIALLVAASVAAWVYSLMMHRSGGNTRTALITASITAFMAFFLVWSITVMVDSAIK